MERPTVTLCGKTFEVNNGKNAMLLLHQYMGEDHGDIEMVSHALEMLLGKDAAAELDALDLPMNELQTVFIAVMAAASGEDFEEAEARFQKSQQ